MNMQAGMRRPWGRIPAFFCRPGVLNGRCALPNQLSVKGIRSSTPSHAPPCPTTSLRFRCRKSAPIADAYAAYDDLAGDPMPRFRDAVTALELLLICSNRDGPLGRKPNGGPPMSHLSPQSLTRDELQALLHATANHPRDRTLLSLALGTGLRLGELTGLVVGDLFLPDGQPRQRVRVRPEIAKRGRAGDFFLPDALASKLSALWRYNVGHRVSVDPQAPVFCGISRRRISPRRVQVLFRQLQQRAGFGRIYCFHILRHHRCHQRVPGVLGSLPRPALRSACNSSDDYDLHPCVRRGTSGPHPSAHMLNLR